MLLNGTEGLLLGVKERTADPDPGPHKEGYIDTLQRALQASDRSLSTSCESGRWDSLAVATILIFLSFLPSLFRDQHKSHDSEP